MGDVTDKPVFMLTLDTELAWGRIRDSDSHVLAAMRRDPTSIRGTIDYLLSIFRKHDIAATWAIVGHLFLDHCSKEDGLAHKNMPRFERDWYSFDPSSDIRRAPLYYGKDIVERILSSPVKHEIGLHSFSHVLFSECDREVAQAEIREGVKLARQFGITPKSFVFPENKVGHIDVLRENGLKIYRGPDLTRADPAQSYLHRKFNGAMDMIIPKVAEPIWRQGIWEIPGNGMFGEIPQIPSGVIIRGKLGLERAIRQNGIFHVWLHPYNLVLQPSLAGHIDRFLCFISRKRDEGKIRVMTMAELASSLKVPSD